MTRCLSSSPRGAQENQSSPASASFQASGTTVQCELHAGHEGRHRSGGDGWGLVWHDPPLLIIGEEGV